MRLHRKIIVLALALAPVTSCLPKDLRPPPTELYVSIRGVQQNVDGVTTVDGWTVEFDRVLSSVGSPDLDGDACEEYADTDYTRIIDARRVSSQKLSLVYGIGTCAFRFRTRSPDVFTVLGEGVSEADKTMMRDGATDPFETEPRGITHLVRGTATKGAITKSFDWKFRRFRTRLDDCVIGGQKTITLEESGSATVELEIHAEVLLQDHLVLDDTALRFDHLAAADADGDGAITLEELTKVPLAETSVTLPEVTPEDKESAEWKTLGDYVYLGLFPRIVRPAGNGTCKVNGQR